MGIRCFCIVFSMDTLGSLFAGRRMPEEPPEIAAIKAYVKNAFDRDVSVAVRDGGLVVMAANASLANALRLRLHDLRRLAGEKPVTIRIGRAA